MNTPLVIREEKSQDFHDVMSLRAEVIPHRIQYSEFRGNLSAFFCTFLG